MRSYGLLKSGQPAHLLGKVARLLGIDDSYGYRDSAFFFLKIKAAFPGNP